MRGLTKAEIRELSRLAGLPTWDRPASACLSSRIPYGTPVTIENVKTVETGEEEIKALGFRQFRVRFHGEVVRIEIAPDEMAKALTLEMARALHRNLQGARLPLRDARPGRLPPGLAERSAEPEALREPASSSPALPRAMVRRRTAAIVAYSGRHPSCW